MQHKKKLFLPRFAQIAWQKFKGRNKTQLSKTNFLIKGPFTQKLPAKIMNPVDFLKEKPFINYNIVIYYIALTENDYPLYFKMMNGGENWSNYKHLNQARNFLEFVKQNGLDGYPIPLNPDGTIYFSHYQIACAIIAELNHVDVIKKVIDSGDPWVCDEKWLKSTYTKEEQKKIKDTLKKLIK